MAGQRGECNLRSAGDSQGLQSWFSDKCKYLLWLWVLCGQSPCGNNRLQQHRQRWLIAVFWVLQGLKLLDEYEYIAIFDADFKPNTDFLV